jgi:hypothetical protein
VGGIGKDENMTSKPYQIKGNNKGVLLNTNILCI